MQKYIFISSLVIVFLFFIGIKEVSAQIETNYAGLNVHQVLDQPNVDVRCEGMLGPLKQDLEGILMIIRIVAPLIVLALGTYDYITSIVSKDAELLKKANSKLVKRLTLMALLFFLPSLLNILLGWVDVTYQTCVG